MCYLSFFKIICGIETLQYFYLLVREQKNGRSGIGEEQGKDFALSFPLLYMREDKRWKFEKISFLNLVENAKPFESKGTC